MPVMETSSSFLAWSPFKVDALGLVTLLGSEEADRTIGRLVSSSITEYLPLVAGFVVANDRFKDHVPGLIVYNITDSICASDVTGWLSRWLLCQNFT